MFLLKVVFFAVLPSCYCRQGPVSSSSFAMNPAAFNQASSHPFSSVQLHSFNPTPSNHFNQAAKKPFNQASKKVFNQAPKKPFNQATRNGFNQASSHPFNNAPSQPNHQAPSQPFNPFSPHPINPCQGMNCPPDSICTLTRRNCLPFFPCPPLANCVAAPRREDTPFTLQKGNNNGLPERFLPSLQHPKFNNALVKGLSTPQIIQNPFVEKIGPQNKFSMLTNSVHQGRKNPMVFLTQTELDKKLKRQDAGRKQDRILALFNNLRQSKPFFRLKGPGLVNPPPNRKMNLNAPAKPRRGVPPTTAVKAVHDIRPWEQIDVFNIANRKEPVYKAVIEKLDKRTGDKKKVVLKHDGFEPKPKNPLFAFNMETFKKELQQIKIKDLTSILKKVFPPPGKESSKTEDFNSIRKIDQNVREELPPLSPIEPEFTFNENISSGQLNQWPNFPTTKQKMKKASATLNEGKKMRKVLRKKQANKSRGVVQKKSKIVENKFDSENAATTKFDIAANIWPKIPAIIIEEDDTGDRAGKHLSTSPRTSYTHASESYLEQGQSVPETYKVDFERTPSKKHHISLSEFDEIRQAVESG